MGVIGKTGNIALKRKDFNNYRYAIYRLSDKKITVASVTNSLQYIRVKSYLLSIGSYK